MKNLATLALLVSFAAMGAIVACGDSTPPPSSPSNATSAAPADSSAPPAAPAPSK
jgi:hypothetical protein